MMRFLLIALLLVSGAVLAQNPETVTLTSGGRSRSALVYWPSAPVGDAPVILAYHGGGGTPSGMAARSEIHLQTWASEKAVVVYPTGWGAQWHVGEFCCGQALTDNVDDIQFTSDLLDELDTSQSIDYDRVFATGMSSGGMMVYHLACDSSLVRAIAPSGATQNDFSCSNPANNVAIWHFHGIADKCAPYKGGEPRCGSSLYAQASVRNTLDSWAKVHNGCTQETAFEITNADCGMHYLCDDDVTVTGCVIRGLGHQWPNDQVGGYVEELGPHQSEPDMSALIVQWFQTFF